MTRTAAQIATQNANRAFARFGTAVVVVAIVDVLIADDDTVLVLGRVENEAVVEACGSRRWILSQIAADGMLDCEPCWATEGQVRGYLAGCKHKGELVRI
jgi:hypothetical protein